MWNRALLCTAGILIGLSPVIGSVSQPRILSFEERVEAQRTIERVYYAHQTGASRPFDQAVPDEVLERKVQLYLKLSVALERVWSRPVTSGALEKEQNRITRATRSPERLREINDALGWDPLLIQETFVRSTLVHRTIASLFPFDRRIHAQARSEAEQLRADLIDGSINVYDPHPRRRLVEISQDGGQSAASAAMRAEPHDVNRVDLTPEDYSSLRERAGSTSRDRPGRRDRGSLRDPGRS